MDLSKLDDLLLQTVKELQEKENMLKQLMEDVQRLNKEAMTLEKARELLVKHHVPRQSLKDLLDSSPPAKHSLQEEILKFLFEHHEDDYFAVADITRQLKEMGYHQGEKRHFYIMVYNTLKRMFGKGLLLVERVDGTDKYQLSEAGVEMAQSLRNT